MLARGAVVVCERYTAAVFGAAVSHVGALWVLFAVSGLARDALALARRAQAHLGTTSRPLTIGVALHAAVAVHHAAAPDAPAHARRLAISVAGHAFAGGSGAAMDLLAVRRLLAVRVARGHANAILCLTRAVQLA